ncbi:Putative glycerol kinase 5 [Melipona quadrifasciata]|uniref:Glycerol kinase 5 n=1 Tax=Melipona quadrifasciata TaxID=166423 RepID=A0A0N0U7P6_9HYME|nr:Putative glycerol kinase 5 [Melipona quadrifasciata]
MNKLNYIGALHIGTTTVRFHIIDGQGTTIASSAEKLQLLYPQPGYVEIDPDELWLLVIKVMKDTFRESGFCPEYLRGLGISTQRCSFTTWNPRDGRHFHNIITWRDLRANKLVNEWNSSYQTRALRIGSRLMYTFLKEHRYLMMSDFKFMNSQITLRLLWALQNVQELKDEAKKGNALMGCIDTWLLYKFTGRHVTDVSNAAATGIFDPFLMNWSTAMISILKLPPGLFPKVVNSSGDFGVTHKCIFGVEIPIYCLMAAQSASLFGSGCLHTGDLKITLGTGTFVNVNSGSEMHTSTSGMYPAIGWRIGEELVYMIEGAWNDTGSIVEWAKQIGLIDQLAETVDIANSVDESEGVFFVPAFSGLHAPINDYTAAAGFIGIEPTTEKAHIIRAMLESIAYGIVLIFEVLRRETSHSRIKIRVDGGVSANDFVLQLIADLTGFVVERATSTEMSILGVAFVAGLQCGIWKRKEDVYKLRKVDRTFKPNILNRIRYRLLIPHWKRALEKFGRCVSRYWEITSPERNILLTASLNFEQKMTEQQISSVPSEVVLEIDEELIYAGAQNMLPVVDECRITVDSDLSNDTQTTQTDGKMADYASLVDRTRTVFLNGKTRSLEWRIKQLKQALLMLEECEQEIISALATDLHKCKFETVSTEIKFTEAEVIELLRHLKEWSADEKVCLTFYNFLCITN